MTENQWLQVLVTLPYVLVLSLLGGLASFIMRLNQATEPKPLGKIFLNLFGELFLSGFAGLTTFLLCREWELSLNITAVAVAISGHLGGNAINQLTKIYDNVINKGS
ncbi:phage holin family protein [Moraxella nasovis]|uniref:phage holin family protein n=1 Tax=Moraxella nasovis TaxID=2904121 RepID=UPI001F60CAC7|nr:phage holin family protein [Moraxella nasovis]UNU73294.1 phage holin family protein [Moraxella nasovis]